MSSPLSLQSALGREVREPIRRGNSGGARSPMRLYSPLCCAEMQCVTILKVPLSSRPSSAPVVVVQCGGGHHGPPFSQKWLSRKSFRAASIPSKDFTVFGHWRALRTLASAGESSSARTRPVREWHAVALAQTHQYIPNSADTQAVADNKLASRAGTPEVDIFGLRIGILKAGAHLPASGSAT